VIEGSGSGSIPLTNGSGSGLGSGSATLFHTIKYNCFTILSEYSSFLLASRCNAIVIQVWEGDIFELGKIIQEGRLNLN
jgi:hypothetical protein